MGLTIKTKSPILYTSDCGQTFLNADGTQSQYGPMPNDSALKGLPPPPNSTNQNPNPKKEKKKLDLGKVRKGVEDVAGITDSLKNIFSGKGRGSAGTDPNAPVMPQMDNNGANNDAKKKGMGNGAKIGIAISAVAVIAIVIYVSKKK